MRGYMRFSCGGKVLEASRIFRDMQIDKELGLPQPNGKTYDLMLEGFCREGMWEEVEMLVSSMKEKFGTMTLQSYNIQLLEMVRKGRLLEWHSLIAEMVTSVD
ncbi:hypothetical protein MLD38_026853 [Melastoma candidum]|uniref:Uncharacterized protein n=1 Tax=Melastoma candidum TaxID=119954 RepID=A0ACB9P0Y1_9MYRT|nr:hypothetical protein MLD38_026853 [Melastoma candidum]